MAEEAKPSTQFDAGHVPMTEEMDSPKRTLPPMLPMFIAFLVVGAAIAIYFMSAKEPPAYICKIGKAVVFSVHTESAPAAPGYGISEVGVQTETHDMVVMLVQLNIENPHPKNKLYIKGITAMLSSDNGETEDLAASGSDYDRLFQAYPALLPYRDKPIPPEAEIKPGEHFTGAEIFGFQMPLKDFQKSKTLTIEIALYNRDTIVLPLQASQLEVIASPVPEVQKKHKK